MSLTREWYELKGNRVILRTGPGFVLVSSVTAALAARVLKNDLHIFLINCNYETFSTQKASVTFLYHFTIVTPHLPVLFPEIYFPVAADRNVGYRNPDRF